MRYLSVLAILMLSLQAEAFGTVKAEGFAADCCFRGIGDLDLIIQAAEEAKQNLFTECKELYGDRGQIYARSQKVLTLETAFEGAGASVLTRATATCVKR